MLIISGHYDGGNEFFSDRLDVSEFLPVDELERVSCSDSCPGLFSQLKEVYLFGCNTLNPRPLSSASAEVVRSLVREGHSLKEAERQLQIVERRRTARAAATACAMVFKDVPVIYGFSSMAPLGPVASVHAERLLPGGRRPRDRSAAARAAACSGNSRLRGMSVTQGMTDEDPHADVRRDVCQFADDRLSDAQKLDFVHQILQRPTAEARIHLDRIQRLTHGARRPRTADAGGGPGARGHRARRRRPDALSRLRTRCRPACGAARA